MYNNFDFSRRNEKIPTSILVVSIIYFIAAISNLAVRFYFHGTLVFTTAIIDIILLVLMIIFLAINKKAFN